MASWIWALAFACLAAACLRTPDAASAKPAQALGFAPIEYFDQHCARCHGVEGEFFGDEFGKDLDDAGLREKVRAMAAGPGGAPIEGSHLGAVVAYHRAMIAKEPFVAWTGASKDKLEFEVSPGAEFVAKAGENVLEVSKGEGAYEVKLPAGMAASSVVVEAARGESKTQLELSKATTSHARPLVAK